MTRKIKTEHLLKNERVTNMTTLKVIKNDQEYDVALEEVEHLMSLDLSLNSAEGNALEVLSVLIEKYENEHVDIEPPTPIDAIKFCMDQRGLKNKDLIPYIGSSGKVSEFLNGKRPLSLDMIRALHKGLKIPYSSLMNHPKDIENEASADCSRYPLKEMLKHKLIKVKKGLSFKDNSEDYIRDYFGPNYNMQVAGCLKSGESKRTGREMKFESLLVWHNEVIKIAENQKVGKNFELDSLDDNFFETLVNLSSLPTGPLEAKKYLSQHGIRLVHFVHFQKTYLDGAALKLDDGAPVVALTFRHDRLDNFWFVLLHELAHIKLHLYSNKHDTNLNAIYDDLDVGSDGQAPIEKQADDFARDKLIPSTAVDALEKVTTVADISLLAMRYSRSPAIFAGYVRKKKSNYRLFSGLVGNKQVRRLFGLEQELS